MAKTPTRTQVSAGGVAYRRRDGETQVALIRVGSDEDRWQLPKGLIDQDETAEQAAQREVREETGLETELIAPIDTIDYWYYGGSRDGGRVRYHKLVHFFLLKVLSGDTRDHDQEVAEARWVGIEGAIEMLTFDNEKDVTRQAQGMLQERAAWA